MNREYIESSVNATKKEMDFMLDQTTLHNLQLIARLEAQIEDDGFEMRKKRKASKPEVKQPVSGKQALKQDTCTCKTEVRNGKMWKIVTLDCFDHGPSSNRPDPYQARNYNLSRHPYAE